MRYRSYQEFRLSPVLFLIILNLLFFVATTIFPQTVPLLWLHPLGILTRPWTIITSAFVHGGLWHLIFNMITLYFFGSFLSRLVGDGKFLIVYFGGGITGNVFFIVLSILLSALLGSPLAPVVGASGAIFALGGALTVMVPKLRVFVFPIPAPIPLWAAIVGGFLILSFLPFVAWQAHLGGLIFGVIASFFFFRKRQHH